MTAVEVMRVIASHDRGPTGPMTPEIIRARVANYFDVTVTQMLGGCRARTYAYPRAVGMWLARTMVVPRPSYPQIGLVYDKDHSTVIFACQKIQRLVDANPEFGNQLRAIVDTHIAREAA